MIHAPRPRPTQRVIMAYVLPLPARGDSAMQPRARRQLFWAVIVSLAILAVPGVIYLFRWLSAP